MRIFVTADSHYFHKNIIRFCDRPFENVHEMNKVMIQRWNEVIPKDGLTYFLGDFGFGSQDMLRGIRSQLNGEILFIRGSHDNNAIKAFGEMPYIREITIDRQLVVLCHYSMRVWSKSHYNSWHLFGHSHGKLQGQGKSFDVGVDTNNFYPYLLKDIMKRMEGMPNNVNFVGKK